MNLWRWHGYRLDTTLIATRPSEHCSKLGAALHGLSKEMSATQHNKAASGNGAVALCFHFARLSRVVPEQFRSA
jgi:hypothetical protein